MTVDLVNYFITTLLAIKLRNKPISRIGKMGADPLAAD